MIVAVHDCCCLLLLLFLCVGKYRIGEELCCLLFLSVSTPDLSQFFFYFFQVSIVRGQPSEEWRKIKYHVFDIPSSSSLPFEERMSLLKEVVEECEKKSALSLSPNFVHLVEQTRAPSKEWVLVTLQSVLDQDGEGLMLRLPASKFVSSFSLLSLLSFGFF